MAMRFFPLSTIIEESHGYLASSWFETFIVGDVFLIRRESSVTNCSSFALAKQTYEASWNVIFSFNAVSNISSSLQSIP